MLSSKNKYQPVGGDDDLVDNKGDIELATVQESSLSTDFVVKVLYKEASETICTLNVNSTIGELKNAIEAKFSVPVLRQRIIFAGKPLKPDDKPLSFFKINNNATVHLFPIPVPTSDSLSIAVPVNNSSSGAVVPLQYASVHNDAGQSAIHYDPYVNHSLREVRMWCLVLIFLSGMTLFNNLSYMTTTGQFGDGWLDSLVSIVDTLCSAGGLYVGNLGINSIRTLELSDIKSYVTCLGSLGALSILMRVTWVLDIICQVQKAVDESRKNDGTDTDGGGSSTPPTNGHDDVAGKGDVKLTENMVTTYGIQAAIIALIIIVSWGNCMVRAWRLQNAVEAYRESHQPPVAATASNV